MAKNAQKRGGAPAEAPQAAGELKPGYIRDFISGLPARATTEALEAEGLPGRELLAEP